jgi:hypothetical protein
MLWRSLAVYFQNFGFITRVALVGYAPLKFGAFLICQLAGISPGGVAASVIRDFGDGILGALVAPAVIYGIVSRLRSGKLPSAAECLRRGRQLWWKTLWNDIKAEITVGLRLALLIVPGVIAAVRLSFVEAVVAIEGEEQSQVLARSRELSAGHGWQIFFVCLPAVAMGFLNEFLLFSLMEKLGLSWMLAAAIDCVMAIAGQWTTVLLTLLYLAFAPSVEPDAA